MNVKDRNFDLVDALDDIKKRVNELVDDNAVVVYNQNDLEKAPSVDSRLQDPDQGFVSIMYAGMRSESGKGTAANGVSTIGRFAIAVSFKNDGLRMAGIEDPVSMVRFMSELRRALVAQKAPNNKTYTFVSETPWEIPGKGDGYMQEWNLSLSAFS
ncbi:tail-completion protein [Vibrio phage vB_ValS_PJ32]|nr:tail-completion protein [Vibrio phage vB_ValS_PJ32]